MTTPKDKFEPQESPTPLSPLSDAPDDYVNYGRRPASDPLAVLGVGSAVLAFLLWAWRGCKNYHSAAGSTSADAGCYETGWFSTERLPAVAAFLALSFILLLLRRR